MSVSVSTISEILAKAVQEAQSVIDQCPEAKLIEAGDIAVLQCPLCESTSGEWYATTVESYVTDGEFWHHGGESFLSFDRHSTVRDPEVIGVTCSECGDLVRIPSRVNVNF